MKLYVQKTLVIISSITIGIALCSILLEQHIFYAHLFVHFQLQYFLIVLFCSIALLFLKKYVSAIIGIIFCSILYIFFIHKVVFFSSVPSTVDILFLNSQYDSQEIDRTMNLIETLKPTTLALVESHPTLVQNILQTRESPILNHRAYASSCTIFSQEKAIEKTVLGKNHLPMCIINFEHFDLVVVHPHRPMNKAILAENKEFFDDLEKLIQVYEKNNRQFLVVGDFNTTYYSTYFRTRFGQYDQKIFSTWMVGTPLSLPIDHVLTNMKVHVERSSQVGSDHRGLLIDILE